jgi:hypothetical protein
MVSNPSTENIKLHNDIKDVFNREKNISSHTGWHNKTSNLNMEKDSKKLWYLINDEQCHSVCMHADAINNDSNNKKPNIVLEEAEKHHFCKGAANVLANYYREESKITIPKQHYQQVYKDTKDKLKHQKPSACMSTSFTIEELHMATQNLKHSKAPGKDSITNEMIKNLGPTALTLLLQIYNQSWTSGKFPDNWREAIILPVFKKGKIQTDKSSYRPISLLSCPCKVMERMIHTRLMQHLEGNHLLANVQSAFRKNLCTEDQIAYLAQNIENAF